VTPAGSRSVTTTPVASSGPVFAAVTVNVTAAPSMGAEIVRDADNQADTAEEEKRQKLQSCDREHGVEKRHHEENEHRESHKKPLSPGDGPFDGFFGFFRVSHGESNFRLGSRRLSIDRLLSND
jgi:hypothetical protein